MTEEQVKQIIEDVLNVRIRHDRETLFDMGADGVDLLEIEVELQQKFEVEIKFESLTEYMTVSDVIRLVKEAKENEYAKVVY